MIQEMKLNVKWNLNKQATTWYVSLNSIKDMTRWDQIKLHENKLDFSKKIIMRIKTLKRRDEIWLDETDSRLD